VSGTGWIAEHEGRVIGFLMGRAAADEFEILNLAVTQACRRRGVATGLLQTMAAWARTAGTKRAYLEVRASNEGALALYMHHGFTACGRRTAYYQNPREDAILLSWDKIGTL
jgi:ribosomal-protein-alanine N-acetyltransferase